MVRKVLRCLRRVNILDLKTMKKKNKENKVTIHDLY